VAAHPEREAAYPPVAYPQGIEHILRQGHRVVRVQRGRAAPGERVGHAARVSIYYLFVGNISRKPAAHARGRRARGLW
jgi:hypothetical protein